MKQAIVKYFGRFSYPQVEFANAIKKELKPTGIYELVDAPCGKGVTAWLFSEDSRSNICAYDINEAVIVKARETFIKNNLHYEVADIRDAIKKHKAADYFCIINSLFLLPEPGNILKSIKEYTIKNCHLYVIIPNIESKGYKWFVKNNPTINKLSLSQADFAIFFNQCGWQICKTKPIVYARSLGRKDVALFSICAPFYLRILNYFQTVFRIGEPNYFMLELEKNK